MLINVIKLKTDIKIKISKNIYNWYEANPKISRYRPFKYKWGHSNLTNIRYYKI